MAETDSVLEGEILNHGPSVDSLVIVLKEMKKAGRLNDVIQVCMKFLSVYPDDIRLRILLAEAFMGTGFIGLAEAELEKATSMIDHLTSAYKLLAEVYAKQKRFEAAAEALKLYLAHRPNEPEAVKLLEEMELTLLSGEIPLKGEESTEDVVPAAGEPKDAVVDFATPTIAELYLTQGQIRAAISTYEKVVSSNPDDTESLRRLTELKGMATETSVPKNEATGDLQAQKEKLIMTLERWLPKIKEIGNA